MLKERRAITAVGWAEVYWKASFVATWQGATKRICKTDGGV